MESKFLSFLIKFKSKVELLDININLSSFDLMIQNHVDNLLIITKMGVLSYSRKINEMQTEIVFWIEKSKTLEINQPFKERKNTMGRW